MLKQKTQFEILCFRNRKTKPNSNEIDDGREFEKKIFHRLFGKEGD